MKKNIIVMFSLLITITLVLSCCGAKDTEGLTRVTYYPTLQVQGDSYVVVDKGTTYTDDGCKATLNGEDVSSKLIVTNTVNTNKSGLYSVTYLYTNADGIPFSASRTVVVLDPNDPSEGFFMSSADSYRDNAGSKEVYGGSYEFLVINNSDGTVSMEDLFGGFYSDHRGYGSSYRTSGVVNVASDGTLSLKSSSNTPWGDAFYELTGTFDESKKEYNFVSSYNTYTFHVTMTKK